MSYYIRNLAVAMDYNFTGNRETYGSTFNVSAKLIRANIPQMEHFKQAFFQEQHKDRHMYVHVPSSQNGFKQPGLLH